jgi:1-acyl-sn-glycerol-3-phosphate acyltransferase
VLGIFPEGTRQRSGVLGKAEPGVAHLAMKTGAPVVPVAVRGTCYPFPGKAIRALIGKPIIPPSGHNPRDNADRFAEEIMEAISRLLTGRKT